MQSSCQTNKYIGTEEDSWHEDTFDFQEYLQSDDLAERRDHSKVLSILVSVTGSDPQQSYGTSYVPTKGFQRHTID